MGRKKAYDVTNLKKGQREAAFLLMEYMMADSQYSSKGEIAEAVGITRQTLHNWETRDDNFIAFLNELCETFMESRRSEVYAHLLKKIRQGSIKGMELYLKNRGLLQERVEHTHIEEDANLSERQMMLEERLMRLLDEEVLKGDKNNKEE